MALSGFGGRGRGWLFSGALSSGRGKRRALAHANADPRRRVGVAEPREAASKAAEVAAVAAAGGRGGRRSRRPAVDEVR